MKKPRKCSVKWKWIVLWSLWAARLVRQPTLPVVISSGVLRGSVSPDGSHLNYLGIPYATVQERFQVAVEDPKWEGVFEAINEHKHCHQKMKYMITGHENCLVINVYTPMHATPGVSLPVMVYIPEGGFYFGTGSRFMHGPEYLVAKDIILVTFNYRIGILGFLCLGIKQAPGNMGLKDQVAALRWVQRNIRVFGGDPDNVTLFGESAGACSITFHMLASISKGLFHKAIIQSGSAIAPWGIQPDPIDTASRQAKALGYESKDPYELYNIFYKKTAEELVRAEIPRPEGESYFAEVVYIPCVEKTIESEIPFITDLPYNMFQIGNYTTVPTIIGLNSEEGYLFTALENSTVLEKLNFDKALPKDLVFPNEHERKETAKMVKTMYVGNFNVTDNILGYSRFLGEPFFMYPTVEQTDIFLNTSDQPVYSYFLNYSGWRNFVKLKAGLRFVFEPGATHADDLMYLFKPCMTPSFFEDRMIDVVTTYWTNFAKYGEPNPKEWPPTDKNDPHSLILGATQTQPLWYSASLRFWRDLYEKYRRRRLNNSDESLD